MQKSASNRAPMSKKKASSLKKTDAESRREEATDLESEYDPPSTAEKSENVKVAVRIRPMN